MRTPSWRSRGVVLAAGLAAFLAPGTVSYALWSTTASGTVFVTTAAPPTAQLPGAPSALSCPSFQNNNVVNLSWAAGSEAVSYRIYRRQGTSPLSYTLVKTSTVTTAQVNRNSDFSPAVSSATLIVRAVNTAGESLDSNAVTVNFTANPQNCSAVTP